MRRPLLVAAGLIILSAAAGGCYPNRLDSTDYDVVAAVHDSTGNFTAVTYALKDTVVHLVLPSGSDNISRAIDPAILGTIRTNMNNRGYTEVTGPGAETTADLRLVAAVSTSEYTAYYWDYWCGIYWYGCYYPPYYGSYTYTTGTVFVAMQDRRAPVGGNFPLIWLGVGNGLLGSGANVTKVTAAINEMFVLSPYVSAN